MRRNPTRRPSTRPVDAAVNDRVVVENVNHPGSSRPVNGAKYRAMRDALLNVVPRGRPGLTYEEMSGKVLSHLPSDLFPGGARAGWWLKTVQLDLEAKKRIVRGTTSPLRWRRL